MCICHLNFVIGITIKISNRKFNVQINPCKSSKSISKRGHWFWVGKTINKLNYNVNVNNLKLAITWWLSVFARCLHFLSQSHLTHPVTTCSLCPSISISQAFLDGWEGEIGRDTENFRFSYWAASPTASDQPE